MVMRDIRKGKDILAWQGNTLIYIFHPLTSELKLRRILLISLLLHESHASCLDIFCAGITVAISLIKLQSGGVCDRGDIVGGKKHRPDKTGY